MRRARARIAIFRPLRCASWAPHVVSHVDRPRFIMTVATWHNARLKLTSPGLVMPPDTSRSPDWLREGVSPTEGPILFEDRKRVGSSTAARKGEAIIAIGSRPMADSALRSNVTTRAISAFVAALVVFDWGLVLLPARNPGAYPFVLQCFSAPISVMAPVPEQPVGIRQAAREGLGSDVIADLPGGHEQVQRATLAVTDRVQFGVHATLGATDQTTAPLFRALTGRGAPRQEGTSPKFIGWPLRR